MKQRIFFILKILVSAVLVYWLIRHVDWQAVLTELTEVSWPLLILYVLLQLASILLSVRKWQVIAEFKKIEFSLKEGFFTYLTGSFINNFLPSIIGGDAYRSLWLAEKSGARAAAVSTVLFDRFIGLWTTAIMAVLLSYLLRDAFAESLALSVTVSILVFLLFLDIIVTYLYCREWFPGLLAKIPFQKVRRLFTEVVTYADKDLWLRTSLWSIGFILAGLVLSNYVLFAALGYQLNFVSFLSVACLVAIVTSLPITIGNIGVKEWAHVVFFGLIGVSAEAAVTVALLSRFIQMFLSFAALPHYLAGRAVDKNEKDPLRAAR